jgi:hypothetical protein
MKIQLLEDCGFTITDHLDENEEPVEIDESFTKGDILDGDLKSNHKGYINFQFADGAMLYGLKKNLFKVIEKD